MLQATNIFLRSLVSLVCATSCCSACAGRPCKGMHRPCPMRTRTLNPKSSHRPTRWRGRRAPTRWSARTASAPSCSTRPARSRWGGRPCPTSGCLARRVQLLQSARRLRAERNLTCNVLLLALSAFLRYLSELLDRLGLYFCTPRRPSCCQCAQALLHKAAACILCFCYWAALAE